LSVAACRLLTTGSIGPPYGRLGAGATGVTPHLPFLNQAPEKEICVERGCRARQRFVCMYTEFLNTVAATDTYGLYITGMWRDALGCKIQRIGTSGTHTYSVATDRANRPVNYAGTAAGPCTVFLRACRPGSSLRPGRGKPSGGGKGMGRPVGECANHRSTGASPVVAGREWGGRSASSRARCLIASG
jgi:hypothetical protein